MDDDVPPGFTANAAAADDVPPGFTAKMGPGAATTTAGPPPGIAAPAAGDAASSKVSEGLAAHLKQSAKVGNLLMQVAELALLVCACCSACAAGYADRSYSFIPGCGYSWFG
jgi:hypothetical protein